MTAKPDDMKITVSFATMDHARMHKVLCAPAYEFGFTCTVQADGMAGLNYFHPKKGLRVELTDLDGKNGYRVYKTRSGEMDKLIDEMNYTVAEEEWITNAVEDVCVELERELHILCKVRPNIYSPKLSPRLEESAAIAALEDDEVT
jgi:hypothetical protein